MKIPVWKNTLTNYFSVGVRLLQGILVSRWIIGYLGMEQYGLWVLLWSFFVYALLLDFGCGAAAQKYTSGGLYEEDAGKFSRLISTIYTYHWLMGAVIALAAFGCSFFLSVLLKIQDPERLRYAWKCFMLFGLGSALLFPTGIFPEMLVGMQKIYVRNYITIVSKSVELLGVLLILYWDGGLIPLIAFGMAMGLVTNWTMGAVVLRLLPNLKLRWQWDGPSWREVAGFSTFVYLGMLSRMVLNRSSRLLISIFCGMTSVGIFQLSSKVADLSLQAVNQYQENISPISGALHRRGKFRMLGRIIFGSMRLNSLSAYGVMMTSFLLAEPLLEALFKVKNPEITYLSRLFLISMFLSVAVRNIPQRFFMMSDRHQLASWIIVGEALANLVLNILLLNVYGMSVVIWNSLGIKLLISLFIIFPYMVKCLHISIWKFVRDIVIFPIFVGLPSLVYLLVLNHGFTLSSWGGCHDWRRRIRDIVCRDDVFDASAESANEISAKITETADAVPSELIPNPARRSVLSAFQ